MTAGVAAAEVTFSVAAGIALVDDNGAHAAATHTTYCLAETELRAEATLADALDAKMRWQIQQRRKQQQLTKQLKQLKKH